MTGAAVRGSRNPFRSRLRAGVVVVVTHAEMLAQMADKIVHIKDGRLVSGG